tara:strand:- start:1740 stop:2450 length:711 start_codon:yes stop_codon:yes gene_type:complete
MRIACWSGPRNISTALMRSWSSRKDTFVSDEPFYAYYLKKTKLKHPMHKKILKSYPSNYTDVVSYLNNEIPQNKKIWYQKHMAHHILNIDRISWIGECKNCILLRHPKEVISSYVKKNELNSVNELGYSQQFEIAKFLKKINKSFIVIDSCELLEDPEKILSKWCEKIGIKFDKSMLSWEKGNHVNDGIWWESWYDNVVKTTGFQKYKKKDINIENKYYSIYNKSMEYYNYLKDMI